MCPVTDVAQRIKMMHIGVQSSQKTKPVPQMGWYISGKGIN